MTHPLPTHRTHTPEGAPIPQFTPFVPQRRRATGWTAAIQRAFIAELTRIGSANAAAKAVGRSVRSAYVLRDKPGAESFAAAWVEALARGRDAVRDTATERALYGEVAPRYRNGRFTGYHMVRNDHLLTGVLNARESRIGPFGEHHDRLERWETALRRAELDKADRAPKAGEAEGAAWDAHVVWEEEIRREQRRKHAAEIRAKLRKSAGPRAPVLRIRAL